MRLQPGVVMPGGVVSGAASGGGARTEAEFNAHIAALATGGQRDWAPQAQVNAGSYWTVGGPAAGSMSSTVWNDTAWQSVSPCRLVQHAVPSNAVFVQIVTTNMPVFFRVEGRGSKVDFVGLSRNGYTSNTENDGNSYGVIACTKIIRWNRTLNKAVQSDPSTGSAETEYIF